MTRRRRGYRVNGFTMDDIARATGGDLVGDRSDEPRLTVDEAVAMLAESNSLAQTQSVLGLVRGRDRRRVIRRADMLRRNRQSRTRRRSWSDRALPFGEEVEF